jgi:hypothetical protein
MQVGHRRVERKERVQRQRRILSVERQRPLAAQLDPARVADRRDRGEAVEAAAQNDGEEPRIAAFRPRQSSSLAGFVSS